MRDARPEYADQSDGDDERRHSQKEVQQCHHDAIRRPPQESCDHPDSDAKKCCDCDNEQRDRQADLPAVQDARKNVAPELIRSEEMPRHIARQTHRQILFIGIVGSDIGCKHCEQHPYDEQHADDAEIPTAQQSAPQITHS